MKKNPIKLLREEAGLSMETLAERSEVSKQTVLRAEQGCYDLIPPSIFNYMLSAWPYSEIINLPTRYRDWQKEQRKQNYGELSTLITWDFLSPAVHPFIYWRETSNIYARIQISKLYCVHPATISRFEHSNALSSSVPEQLIDALLESGYSLATIEKLCDLYERWAVIIQTSGFQIQEAKWVN